MEPERYQHWLISLLQGLSLSGFAPSKLNNTFETLSLGNVEPDLRCGQALDLLVHPS